MGYGDCSRLIRYLRSSDRALAVIDSVINSQSLDVDTVSGATYSSAGIINAVKNTLENAVINGEL